MGGGGSVPGQAGVVSGEGQVIFLQPNVEIVVLSSPAPELVGESVHLPELLHRYGGDSAEIF